jgi:superfamily II DNA/RNA helicase
MNLDYHLKNITFKLKYIDGADDKIIFEKKLKHLQSIIDSTHGKTIICCNDTHIKNLKEYFKRKSYKFLSMDEGDRVGMRLFEMMRYNKEDSTVLLITPIFLKSLNIIKLSQMIIFDYISDQKDMMRTLAKFPKSDEESNKNLYLLYDNKDLENKENKMFIDHLSQIPSK